jgi:cytochrome c oxidase subunit I
MLLIGTGFLLLFLEAARAIIKKYGSLATSLGWQQILGRQSGFWPPPTVVASTWFVLLILRHLLRVLPSFLSA